MAIKPELKRLDSESEEAFELMAKIIREELDVYVASGEIKPLTSDATSRAADVAADALLNRLVVRLRTEDNPAARWVYDEDDGNDGHIDTDES